MALWGFKGRCSLDKLRAVVGRVKLGMCKALAWGRALVFNAPEMDLEAGK